MSAYIVRCVFPVYMSITVEADDEEAAIDAASDVMYLSGYCGNGGSDKLVGTAKGNVSLEPGDSPLEGDGFTIEAELQE